MIEIVMLIIFCSICIGVIIHGVYMLIAMKKRMKAYTDSLQRSRELLEEGRQHIEKSKANVRIGIYVDGKKIGECKTTTVAMRDSKSWGSVDDIYLN